MMFTPYPVGENRLGLFELGPAGGTETLARAIDEVDQHPQARGGAFRGNFLRREGSGDGGCVLVEQSLGWVGGIAGHGRDPLPGLTFMLVRRHDRPPWISVDETSRAPTSRPVPVS